MFLLFTLRIIFNLKTIIFKYTVLYISGRKIFSLNKVFNFFKSEALNNFFNVIIFPFIFSLKVNILSFFSLMLTYKKFIRIFSVFSSGIVIGFSFS